MTNTQLLTTPREILGALDRQKLFLLRAQSQAVPCPACKKAVNAFTAAGITIDEFDFAETQYAYKCPRCGAELEQILPFLATGPIWTWQLNDVWLRRQLDQLRAAAGIPPTQGDSPSP